MHTFSPWKPFVLSVGLTAALAAAALHAQSAPAGTATPVAKAQGLPDPAIAALPADDGYACWLRYAPISDPALLQTYRKAIGEIVTHEHSPMVSRAVEELTTGLGGLLGEKITASDKVSRDGAISLEKIKTAPGALDGSFGIHTRTEAGKRSIVIESASDRGLLYGAFCFLRLIQTHQPVDSLQIVDGPKIAVRAIDHWDNFNGTIERGYAGRSIFNWDELPKLDGRYHDYARLLASMGINMIVINNVNAQADYLDSKNLPKIAALAGVFREYGIRLCLSIRYDSPTEMSKVSSDPLDPACQRWWNEKVAEIYAQIPDFGGFQVKADAEGQPGPSKFGRTHAEGARVLAQPLKAHGGIVMWRAFVYGKKLKINKDRPCQPYEWFHTLDGKFDDNVILQVKYGPIDFQVREPESTLLCGMPRTHEMMELQITQEYTGQAKHLCWLVPLWKQALDFDTQGDGHSASKGRLSGISGISNIGSDRNWTGHPLAQANLYGFGRVAWNPDLSSQQIAGEWVKMTFGDESVVKTLVAILQESWPTYEKYTSPLGLGMLCGSDHSGPDLEKRKPGDHQGVGVERSVQTGSGYAGQYPPAIAAKYETTANCPDELLLFFHRVPYTFRLHSGKTVIQHIYDTHFEGVEQVQGLIAQWQSLHGKIDDLRYGQVLERLQQQLGAAVKWRDAVNGYFFKQSQIPDEKGRIK